MASQIINVIVNSKGAVTVVKQLNDMGAAARTTTTYLNGLKAILASALAFSGVGEIVKVADSFIVMQNRLKQVSNEATSTGESWNRLMDIANNSYSTIQGTVDLYFRVAQAFQAWGKSANEAYEFTDLFQKAAILSGSSMQTTSQAVYQFSQALNKGKLDGDEFRSVLEGLPYVASLIQKSLGVTRAELYEMSKDGKISVDRIRTAFQDAAKVINGDWANITPTIGMALTVLNNNWVDFVGRVQTSTGIFTAAAYVILAIANNFDLLAISLAPVAAALAFMAGRLGIGLVVIAFKDLSTTLGLATAAQWLFNAAVAANPYVLAAVALAAVVAGVIYFRNELGLTDEVLAALWNTATSAFTYMIDAIVSIGTSVATLVSDFFEWSNIFPLITSGLTALWSVAVSAFTGIMTVVKKTANFISSTFAPVWIEIVALVQNFSGLIKEVLDYIVNEFTPVIEKLGRVWAKVFEDIKPALSFILKILGDIYDGWVLLANWFKNTFGKVLSDIFEGWMGMLRAVLRFINDIITALRTALALMNSLPGGGGGGKASGAHYGAQFKAGEGFATGGAFKVGGTGAGRDTTPVAFRAERGERVTVETKKQQRSADNSNGGNTSVNVPVSIVNVIDPNMVNQVIRSPAGTREIINVMAANKEQLQHIFGVA